MSSLLGLKYFSQHFSQIVETDNRDQDQNTRKDGKVRSLLDITLCIAEHASPGSCGRLDAQAEKAQCGLFSLIQGNRLTADDPGNVHPGQKSNDQDNIL